MNNFRKIFESPRAELLIHGSVLTWPMFQGETDGDHYVSRVFERELHESSSVIRALFYTIPELLGRPGGWSLIATDLNSGLKLLVTDLLGRDQLYYCYNNKEHSWEIGSSVSELPFRGEDRLYFGSVAKFGYHVGHRTYAQGVCRVLPRQMTMLMPDGGLAFQPFAFQYENLGEGVTLFSQINAAFLYNMPEGPDGLTVLVSGGLDSSIMAHLVMENVRSGGALSEIPIQFLTTTNGEDAGYAQILAASEGFELDFINSEDWMDEEVLLDALIAADSPIDLGSLVPNFRLIKEAKYDYILTGDGPDELFGGYSRMHEYDSQLSDIFQELSFYHLPKLNQTASYLHKQLICPYIDPSILTFALSLDLPERTDKKVLKEAFRGQIPCSIIDRQKFALKSNLVRQDKIAHRMKCINLFKEHLNR